jgi:hypothetical protein
MKQICDAFVLYFPAIYHKFVTNLRFICLVFANPNHNPFFKIAINNNKSTEKIQLNGTISSEVYNNKAWDLALLTQVAKKHEKHILRLEMKRNKSKVRFTRLEEENDNLRREIYELQQNRDDMNVSNGKRKHSNSGSNTDESEEDNVLVIEEAKVEESKPKSMPIFRKGGTRIMCPFNAGRDLCGIFEAQNIDKRTISHEEWKSDNVWDLAVKTNCQTEGCCHSAFSLSKANTLISGYDPDRILNLAGSDWNGFSNSLLSHPRMMLRKHLMEYHNVPHVQMKSDYPVLASNNPPKSKVKKSKTIKKS